MDGPQISLRLLPLFPYFAAFLYGVCVGSFLNVCIYRIPISLSVAAGRSFCPHCGAMVRAYDNIPVLSWIFLSARCRFCKASIPGRYALVELGTGIAAMACAARFGLSFDALYYFLFTAALIVVSGIDLDHWYIPDVISLPGIAVGLACSFFTGVPSPRESFLGAALGWGLLHAVRLSYFALKKKEGLGFGDVKLLAMIGAFTGPEGVLITLVAGPVAGLAAGVVLMLRKRQGLGLGVPFGPFLSFGALVYVFAGPEILAWHARLVL
jgi:leader peptidase (prepilin peptidase)/N-methyltransferase